MSPRLPLSLLNVVYAGMLFYHHPDRLSRLDVAPVRWTLEKRSANI